MRRSQLWKETGRAWQAEETANAKARGWDKHGVFQEWKRAQCGWREVRGIVEDEAE